MQTRYLLLRNNKQSGPYSIDELIGQQLKPTDLVWTEGKSQAWLHPYEMEEFTPTFTKATVSKPGVNAKKETTVQTTSTERVNFDTPQYSTSTTSQSVETSYSNSSKHKHEPLEEEPIKFVFHKKKAPVNYGQVLGTMLAVTMLFIGWQRGWFPIHHTDASQTVVVPLISSESHTAKGRHTSHSAPVIKQEQQPTVLSDAPVEAASAPAGISTTELTQAVSRNTTSVVKERKTTKKVSKPIIAPPVIKQEAITPDLIPAKTDDAAIKTEIVPITTSTTEVKPETEKKKGFGLFRGLFHKKKRDD